MRNEKGRQMIYLLAGGYLIYLAWQMFHSRSEVTGTGLAVSMIASIAFVVVGVVLIISAVRTLMKPDPEEEPEAEEKASEEVSEETSEEAPEAEVIEAEDSQKE